MAEIIDVEAESWEIENDVRRLYAQEMMEQMPRAGYRISDFAAPASLDGEHARAQGHCFSARYATSRATALRHLRKAREIVQYL